MKGFFAKLAFIHRRLWQRDGTYRAAILLGPSPLLGAAAATGLWYGLQALTYPAAPILGHMPWAQARASVMSGTLGAAASKPAVALPHIQSDGSFVGYTPGWRGSIHAVTVLPTLDTDVSPAELKRFTIPGTAIEMDPILLTGETTGQALYVGIGEAMLAVTAAGSYSLGLHIERFGGGPATCLARFVFGGRRVVSDLSVGLHDTVRDFDPVAFDLQLGLYPLAVAFGCWRDGRMAGPGRVTVMLRRPGESASQPIGSAELIRPAP